MLKSAVLLAVMAALVALPGCKKDEPIKPNPANPSPPANQPNPTAQS